MLNAQECSSRAVKLNDIIQDLWYIDENDEEVYRQYIELLKEVYLPEDGQTEYYRHQYSSILGKLIELRSTPDADFSYRLLHHIEKILTIIRNDCRFSNDEEFVKNVGKLYDHISLEVCRLTYTDQIENKINDTRGTLQTKLYDLTHITNELQTNLQNFTDTTQELKHGYGKYKKKIKGLQKETITILGLFSAVVLVFMSGVSFSSSVLQSMQNSSVFKVAAIALLIGLVLLAIIFLLFKFILYVNKTDEEISATPDTRSGDTGKYHLTRFDKTFLIIGSVLLGILLVVAVLWICLRISCKL